MFTTYIPIVIIHSFTLDTSRSVIIGEQSFIHSFIHSFIPCILFMYSIHTSCPSNPADTSISSGSNSRSAGRMVSAQAALNSSDPDPGSNGQLTTLRFELRPALPHSAALPVLG